MVSDVPPSPDTVADLVAALRQDHVIVTGTMGSGAARSSYDRISALVSQLPFTAYVALVSPPADAPVGINAARDLSRAVARRIGEPGLYVVAAGSSVPEALATVPQLDDTLYSLTLTTNTEAIGAAAGIDRSNLEPGVWAEAAVGTALRPIPETDDGTYPGNLPDDVVADLAARDETLALPERPDLVEPAEPAEPWSRGGRIALFVALLAGIGLTVRQSIVGWPGWRGGPAGPGRRPALAAGAPPERAPEPAEIREQASVELDRLIGLLDELASRRQPDRSGLSDAATLARDAAGQLLDETTPAELVGALTLARTGQRDARRVLGQASDPYRCCYLNPLHGAGTEEAAWRLGEAQVSIPVCPACQRRLRAGEQPDAFLLRRGRRNLPYYEGTDLWARTGYGCLVDDYAAQVLTERGRT